VVLLLKRIDELIDGEGGSVVSNRFSFAKVSVFRIKVE
jgi:hypothetical protein